jgi:hypothetical protein
LIVQRNEQGIPMVHPKAQESSVTAISTTTTTTTTTTTSEPLLLRVVYDGLKHFIAQWEDFDAVRARVDREWKASPPRADVISAELHSKIKLVMAEQAKRSSDIRASLSQ